MSRMFQSTQKRVALPRLTFAPPLGGKASLLGVILGTSNHVECVALPVLLSFILHTAIFDRVFRAKCNIGMG